MVTGELEWLRQCNEEERKANLKEKQLRETARKEKIQLQILYEELACQKEEILQQRESLRKQRDEERALSCDLKLKSEILKQQKEEAAEESRSLRELCSCTRKENIQLRMELELLEKKRVAEQKQLQQQTAELAEKNAELVQKENRLPESWIVSCNDIVKEKHIGSGAYGYVAEGVFRGQVVAVKQIHDALLVDRNSIDRIHREIRTMATVRHPNLVLFIAAVLDNQAGPMIITELLDTSLRKAYEEDRLGGNVNLLKIFRDVASALSYLHRHHTPIIHRDVSSANVLLEAMANSRWKAKLSDFGSANLVEHAVTAGEGAIIYTAPEAFPVHYSESPKPQTPKVDVYSYGVLVCEVVNKQLPDPNELEMRLTRVETELPHMYAIIKDCVQYEAEKRPTMEDILKVLP